MQLGYDIKGVAEAGLKGCEDDEVVNLAARENRIIITHDLGFGSIYYFFKRGQVGIIILFVPLLKLILDLPGVKLF